jgi:glycerol-3-phosphate dehydrogenase
MFDASWRARALAGLSEPFDVVVIGGGITGAGILLDASQRGLRVLLVERGDIASGTSSRSSKLIHGGLRYLKQMHFRITRLACRERDRMIALDRHLVRPISFLYPARADDKVPGWTVDFGLWLYDRLTTSARRHVHLEPAEVSALVPGLDLKDLDRAMVYTDALADDAVLTLAVAATGHAFGGLMLTRAEAVEPVADADGLFRGVTLRDLETGRTHRVQAHVVVNAAGVWVDRVRDAFGLEGRRLRPSRGSHIVFPTDRLPLRAAVTLPSPDDGRPVFLIPHPEGVLAGTTDLYHESGLDDPRPSRGEVAYILRAVQSQFPGHGLSERDVVGAFAGLRPILDTHAENPSEASREEEIWEERGLISVAGGKLTTWRVTAEEVVDEVLARLPEERAEAAAPCYTAGTPLVGMAPPDLPDRLRVQADLLDSVAAAMARRLRSWAWWTLSLARDRRELDPLMPGTDLTAAEVRVHLRFGAVLRLEDLLLRRARVGLWAPPLARELVPRLRPLFLEELGWDHTRWDRETAAFHDALTAWVPEGVTP